MWNSSYSFLPIFLKLYRCFCYGLKMCMWFENNIQINFCNFLRIWRLQASVMLISSYSWHLVGASMSHFSGSNTTKSIWMVGALCAEILLQFSANLFETFLSWSEDVHVVWI